MTEAFPFTKADIARSFSLAAPDYDAHSFIQKEMGKRLLQRLNIIKQPPAKILDVGSGTGFLTRQLQSQFPNSDIFGIDLAQGMTQYAKQQKSRKFWIRQPSYICADTERLPFVKNSFDLIFSNFTLQWCYPLDAIFAEFKRVLKPGGMIFFTTLGPQTLFELRKSFASVDSNVHVNTFLDMHDLGDSLLNTQFTDPIMDMEMMTVNYKSVTELLQDLKATGAHNINSQRRKGFTTKNQITRMVSAYEQFKVNDAIPATFEVIYGHAFVDPKPLHRPQADGSVWIPADRIPVLSSP